MEHQVKPVFNHIANLQDVSPLRLSSHETSLYQTILQKSRNFSQSKFFAVKKNRIQCPVIEFQFSKIYFHFKMFAHKNAFLFFSPRRHEEHEEEEMGDGHWVSWQLVVGNWQEVEKVSIIEVFSGMIYPPFFFMFIVFSGTLHVKKIARYPQGALPRSRLLPALRRHLLGIGRSYNQFAGIVFVLIMENCFIPCFDKAVKTSSLYRAVCGPIPINSSKALPGPRPHGFLVFLAAKEREETRRGEVDGDVGLLVSNANRWVSPGGVRKGNGES
jgi:hypothetical protein